MMTLSPLLLILALCNARNTLLDDPRPAVVRAAVARALPLLWKGAEGHRTQRTCFACHNQGVPLVALTTAHERGFALHEEELKKQMEYIADFLADNRAKYRKGQGQGGQVDTAGYALLTLEVGGWKPDDTTEAVVEYLLQHNEDLGHWRTSGNRPPSEASDFSTTYVAVRALRYWGTEKQKERIARRLDAARAWLVRTPAHDTEDHVFRLLAFQVVGAGDKAIQAATEELQMTQRSDGGWAQREQMESDPYATGTALAALHQAGALPVTAPTYRRGLAYLLKTQLDDGSWFVHSRSKPFQTYFESGFPHGADQFISMAASGWAVTALAYACPRSEKPE